MNHPWGVSINEEDELVLQWRNGDKRLTAYVPLHAIDCICSTTGGFDEEAEGALRTAYAWLIAPEGERTQ